MSIVRFPLLPFIRPALQTGVTGIDLVWYLLDSAQSSWVHDKGRGIEREQPSQQHYVSRASTSAADGLGSGPSEGEQCNESQEAVNDEGNTPLLFERKSCAPQGATSIFGLSVASTLALHKICVDHILAIYFMLVASKSTKVCL